MNGGDPSALLRLVVNIVVNQCRGVNQLKRKGEWHDFISLRAASDLVSKEKKDWTQSFSTGVQNTSSFQSDLTGPQLYLRLDEVVKSMVDFHTHPFERGIQRFNIGAHNLPRRVGFLTGRPRP
jgi:hypothetical protein